MQCLYCHKRLGLFASKKRPFCSQQHEDRYHREQVGSALRRLLAPLEEAPPARDRLDSLEPGRQAQKVTRSAVPKPAQLPKPAPASAAEDVAAPPPGPPGPPLVSQPADQRPKPLGQEAAAIGVCIEIPARRTELRRRVALPQVAYSPGGLAEATGSPVEVSALCPPVDCLPAPVRPDTRERNPAALSCPGAIRFPLSSRAEIQRNLEGSVALEVQDAQVALLSARRCTGLVSSGLLPVLGESPVIPRAEDPPPPSRADQTGPALDRIAAGWKSPDRLKIPDSGPVEAVVSAGKFADGTRLFAPPETSRLEERYPAASVAKMPEAPPVAVFLELAPVARNSSVPPFAPDPQKSEPVRTRRCNFQAHPKLAGLRHGDFLTWAPARAAVPKSKELFAGDAVLVSPSSVAPGPDVRANQAGFGWRGEARTVDVPAKGGLLDSRVAAGWPGAVPSLSRPLPPAQTARGPASGIGLETISRIPAQVRASKAAPILFTAAMESVPALANVATVRLAEARYRELAGASQTAEPVQREAVAAVPPIPGKPAIPASDTCWPGTESHGLRLEPLRNSMATGGQIRAPRGQRECLNQAARPALREPPRQEPPPVLPSARDALGFGDIHMAAGQSAELPAQTRSGPGGKLALEAAVEPPPLKRVGFAPPHTLHLANLAGPLCHSTPVPGPGGPVLGCTAPERPRFGSRLAFGFTEPRACSEAPTPAGSFCAWAPKPLACNRLAALPPTFTGRRDAHVHALVRYLGYNAASIGGVPALFPQISKRATRP
jgi:hypothetical protein